MATKADATLVQAAFKEGQTGAMADVPNMKPLFESTANIQKTYMDTMTNVIDQLKQRKEQEDIAKEKGLIIGMAPEGSRKKVMRWKTGFLRIAELTQAKILFFAIDAPSKCIFIGDIFKPTGNVEEDLKFVKNYYSTFNGINPDQF